ncbi:MAG: PilZ domain-containing protein [Candidatus Acidiferrales bacterium]|jgi:hypothetical protein
MPKTIVDSKRPEKDREPRNKDAPGSTAPDVPERRRSARSPFTAGVTAVEPVSQTEIEAHTTDLSAGGCYVDTMNPLPVETNINLRLTKNGKSFHTKARVMYCKAGVGMGLLFTEIAPVQRPILERWFAELRGEAQPEPLPAESPAVPGHSNAASEPSVARSDEHYVVEDLVVLLVQKHVITEDEGEAILRRLRLNAEL